MMTILYCMAALCVVAVLRHKFPSGYNKTLTLLLKFINLLGFAVMALLRRTYSHPGKDSRHGHS